MPFYSHSQTACVSPTWTQVCFCNPEMFCTESGQQCEILISQSPLLFNIWYEKKRNYFSKPPCCNVGSNLTLFIAGEKSSAQCFSTGLYNCKEQDTLRFCFRTKILPQTQHKIVYHKKVMSVKTLDFFHIYKLHAVLICIWCQK